MSNSSWLVDFSIGLVSFVLNLPDGQVKFFEEFKLQKNCESILLIKMFLELVEMTFGLVYASFSLPERQALKMTFFAPCLLNFIPFLHYLREEWWNQFSRKCRKLNFFLRIVFFVYFILFIDSFNDIQSWPCQGTCKVITVFSTLLANPKFNSAIWQLEQARTFLLLSGFEQVLLQYTYWYESDWGATWGGLKWLS